MGRITMPGLFLLLMRFAGSLGVVGFGLLNLCFNGQVVPGLLVMAFGLMFAPFLDKRIYRF